MPDAKTAQVANIVAGQLTTQANSTLAAYLTPSQIPSSLIEGFAKSIHPAQIPTTMSGTALALISAGTTINTITQASLLSGNSNFTGTMGFGGPGSLSTSTAMMSGALGSEQTSITGVLGNGELNLSAFAGNTIDAYITPGAEISSAVTSTVIAGSSINYSTSQLGRTSYWSDNVDQLSASSSAYSITADANYSWQYPVVRDPASVVVFETYTNYREVSETLLELRNSPDDAEWKIDNAVYSNSVSVAAALLEKNIPAPQIYSHGSRSVVFGWEHDDKSLYLTVSGTRLSALLSSPDGNVRAEIPGPSIPQAQAFVTAIKASKIIDPA